MVISPPPIANKKAYEFVWKLVIGSDEVSGKKLLDAGIDYNVEENDTHYVVTGLDGTEFLATVAVYMIGDAKPIFHEANRYYYLYDCIKIGKPQVPDRVARSLFNKDEL